MEVLEQIPGWLAAVVAFLALGWGVLGDKWEREKSWGRMEGKIDGLTKGQEGLRTELKSEIGIVRGDLSELRKESRETRDKVMELSGGLTAPAAKIEGRLEVLERKVGGLEARE